MDNGRFIWLPNWPYLTQGHFNVGGYEMNWDLCIIVTKMLHCLCILILGHFWCQVINSALLSKYCLGGSPPLKMMDNGITKCLNWKVVCQK